MPLRRVTEFPCRRRCMVVLEIRFRIPGHGYVYKR